MTIAIGINFGTYILLAADTRTIYYDWNGNVISYKDDSVKIQKTKIGLITGAGNAQLLDSVKRRLADEEVTHTEEILRIMREERLRHHRLYEKYASPDFRLALESTGWIFTYTTMAEDRVKLRLGIFHPQTGDALALFEENCLAMISPHEATKEQAEVIANLLEKKIKPIQEFTGFSDSIQYHWSILATCIRKIKPIYPSISPCSQVGIHTIDGLTGISRILKETETNISITLTRN